MIIQVDLSTVLKKETAKLKNEMWWRNNKMYFFIAGGVIVSVYVGLAFICGSPKICL